MSLAEYQRYLYWVLKGRCQICGEFNHGRPMCPKCEAEINAVVESLDVS